MIKASETGGVEGVVYNSTNGLPVGRARVAVGGADMETLTDDEGRFFFLNIPAGAARLEVSYLGFASQTAAVTVEPGKTAVRDFQLALRDSARAAAAGTAAAGDEVVLLEKFEVVADQAMSAQALAMNEQRHAANIKNVVAFEDLGSYGQENIGDYIRFLPGVAIVDDGENPGQLALGGFGAEFTNMQLDGGDLASTGVGTTSGRTLALQEVPMVNIERVEVTKVPMPDMPASGLGGSLNLVSKSLLGTKRAYLDYQLYMNFNNKEGLSFDGGARQPVRQLSPKTKQPSASLMLVVPVGRRLAFSLGASRSWRQRPADDTPNENALWNLRRMDDAHPPKPKDIALATAQWSQIAQITSVENIQAAMEWKIARNDTLSLSLQYRETTTETATSRLTTRFHSNNYYDPVSDDPAHYTSAKAGRGVIEMGGNTLLNYENATENTHATLQYKHRGPKWHVDAKGYYSHARRVRSNEGKGYFSGYYASLINLNMRGDGIGEGDSILPTRYTITTNSATNPVAVNPYDGGAYNLNSVRNDHGVYKTDLYSGRADVTRIFNRWFQLKTGASANRLEKDDRRLADPYAFNGPYGPSMSHYDVFDEAIGVTMNGHPVRWISPVKLYNLYLEHKDDGWFTLNDSAIQNVAQNSKKMIEDVFAGYLRFDLRLFQNRLSMTGGVRYEKTKLDGWSMRRDDSAIYVKDENGNRVENPAGGYLLVTTDSKEQMRLKWQERALREGQDYDGFYPSLNINYALTDNLVARAAYARTIGRPDVEYVVAGITIPDPGTTDPELARTITVGNPGLEPWTADSLHLSLDSYLFKGGFGSIGVYRKSVTNFFAKVSTPATEELLQNYGMAENDTAYMLDQGYVLSRWVNWGDAHLTGLEFSYRQDLLFLPQWLQKTQVWVNYTHLEVGGKNAGDFTGFTPDALSWGVNYIRPRFSLRLSFAYQAETKKGMVSVAPGTSASNYMPVLPDKVYDYQNSYLLCGLNAKYSFSRAFSVYVNWSDILAGDRFVYRRVADMPAYAENYQRRAAPSYIMVGVEGRF
ncbi:MAG: TonB-dependent receptor [Opitutaceae bacterium]|nr:TonB-dependent receptor [Opitutaceae bacterium]